MIDEKIRTFTRGRIIYNYEHDRLELNEQLLQCGEWLELRVFDSWIAGQVARDTTGWYLLTLGRVGIRLRGGLTARLCEATISVAAH